MRVYARYVCMLASTCVCVRACVQCVCVCGYVCKCVCVCVCVCDAYFIVRVSCIKRSAAQVIPEYARKCIRHACLHSTCVRLTRFNKIAIHNRLKVDKEAITLSRVQYVIRPCQIYVNSVFICIDTAGVYVHVSSCIHQRYMLVITLFLYSAISLKSSMCFK